VIVEHRSHDPMFRLPLFRIRAFTFGTLSTFLSSLARGGLMFMLIIWLQGIWLPQHGYSFTETPLWAGIYMLPLTVGLLFAGPVSGYLSDRFGARPFATAGMLLTAVGFALLLLLPTNFSYVPVRADPAADRDLDGPVRLAQPGRGDEQPAASDRGPGGAMNQTFQNSAQVLSIGVFFTLMIIGLASTLPQAMSSGLEAHGVSAAAAHRLVIDAAAGVDPVRRVPRLQPDPAPARSHVLAGLSAHTSRS
jgi:MFS family permease